MRILLVPVMGPDPVQDVLYVGLRQAGVDVVDYPYKPLYHCSTSPEGRLVVRQRSGELLGREEDDGMIHFTSLYHHNRVVHKWLSTKDDGRAQGSQGSELKLDDYDVILVGSPREEIADFAKLILQKAAGRAYHLDGEDDPYIRSTYRMSRVYFKREVVIAQKLHTFIKWSPRLLRYAPVFSRNLHFAATTKNLLIPRAQIDRVVSLNVGINAHSHPVAPWEKDYDISFMASMSNPVRAEFAKRLVKFSRKNALRVKVSVYPSWLGNVPWNEYVGIIQRSKIAVSLPGLSYDSMRYWEIPYYGSLLAAPRLPIEIANNFVDMESAILFSSFDEFARKTLEVLKTGLWKDLQRRCKAHFEAHHSSLSRAERFLSYVRHG